MRLTAFIATSALLGTAFFAATFCTSAHAANSSASAQTNSSHVAIVSLAKTPADSPRWELQVDGKPYEVRGVTFSGTGGPSAYDRDCERLAAIGVNTLRVWGAGRDTQALLNAAQKHGQRVMLGLWLRHGQPGAEADDSFDYTTDTKGISDQHAAILESVRRYKNHPALLAWGVGNEVFLNLPNDAAKLAYAKVLEAVCADIKRIDPDHPLVAVDAFNKGLKWVEENCPSVDAHGVNVYGPGVGAVADAMKKAHATRPWLITEYGSRGDWDTPKDANGVKLEVSDADKYRTITDAWNKSLQPEREAGRCLGLFIFNYSNSLTYTNVKHGLLLNDSLRPAWHAVREIYLGEKPSPALPEITKFTATLDNKHSTATDGWMEIQLFITDTAGQPADISFAYNFRSAATRSQRDAIVLLESRPGSTPHSWLVRTPAINGPIKLYALVKASQNTLLTATTSVKLP